VLEVRCYLILAATLAAPAALAADSDNGKRVAETRCVTCHIVAPSQRRDVTDAPPFELIARKFASMAFQLPLQIDAPRTSVSSRGLPHGCESLASSLTHSPAAEIAGRCLS